MFNFYNFETVAPIQKIKETDSCGHQEQGNNAFAQILASEKQKIRKAKEPEEKPVIPFFITPANFDYHV